MLRVKNQRASKARSPYAAMSNVTNTMCCHEVVEEIAVRRTQVRPPVADSSNRNASPPTPATQASTVSTVSTEAGQGMSQSGMIDPGMISLNMPYIVNPIPDAPSAFSSHVPINMNQSTNTYLENSIDSVSFN